MRLPRISFKRKVVASVLAGGIAAGAVAGIAAAYFIGSGHGTAPAVIAKLHPTSWKVTPVSETGQLYPITGTTQWPPPFTPNNPITPVGPYVRIEFQVTNVTPGLLGLPAGPAAGPAAGAITLSFGGFVGPTTPVGTKPHTVPGCHPTWIRDSVAGVVGNWARVKSEAFFDVFVDVALITTKNSPAGQDTCQGLMPQLTLNVG